MRYAEFVTNRQLAHGVTGTIDVRSRESMSLDCLTSNSFHYFSW